jgi:hypothetical protein
MVARLAVMFDAVFTTMQEASIADLVFLRLPSRGSPFERARAQVRL